MRRYESTVDVVVVQWPADSATWTSLVESGAAVLAVVADGAPPPVTSDCCHDWMWAAGGEVELRFRLRQVAMRAGRHGRVPPRLDEHGLLSFAMRSVALPGRERQLASVFVSRFGEVVPRGEVIEAVWPEGLARPAQLAMQLSRLRRRIRSVGLEIVTVPGAAYVMRAAATVPAAADGSFDHEVDAKAVKVKAGGRS